MKRAILATICGLSLVACSHQVSTVDLTPGMTKQDVFQMLGKPLSSTIENGEQYFVFKVSDHAHRRDVNFYSIGFKNDRLTNVILLPENMQR